MSPNKLASSSHTTSARSNLPATEAITSFFCNSLFATLLNKSQKPPATLHKQSGNAHSLGARGGLLWLWPGVTQNSNFPSESRTNPQFIISYWWQMDVKVLQHYLVLLNKLKHNLSIFPHHIHQSERQIWCLMFLQKGPSALHCH